MWRCSLLLACCASLLAGASPALARSLSSKSNSVNVKAPGQVWNGVPANISAVPFVSYIMFPCYGDLWCRCSGSLIKPDVVLTAGHCTASHSNAGVFGTWNTITGQVDPTAANLSLYAVYVGASRIVNDPNGWPINVTDGVQRAVVGAYVYCSTPGNCYQQNADGSTSPNDFALLKLDRPVPSIRPVPLLPALPTKPETFTLVGWGKQSTTDPNWFPVDLLTGSIAFDPTLVYSDGTFDTNPFATDQSACSGDSGGPLLFRGRQAGVVSGAGDCNVAGKQQYNDVYGSVPAHLAWIKATAELLSPAPSPLLPHSLRPPSPSPSPAAIVEPTPPAPAPAPGIEAPAPLPSAEAPLASEQGAAAPAAAPAEAQLAGGQVIG